MAILPFRPSAQKRFQRLVQPHLQALHAFAYRLTGSRQDAEDLVQDVVVKLYPRLDELEPVSQLRPWLNRVLYRQFIDSVRKKGRQADSPASDMIDSENQADWLDSLASDALSPELELNRERLGPLLDKALDQLSPDQRTLLLLHDVDGWRQEDVAEVLSVPVGTVKSRLHRSRAALRKYLRGSMEPDADFERRDY
ncbi:RNA polymerase sigma factor [Marinobacter sp.]|uniref:RNA polymerase sigma factor n=1 Tax=Marinobacter sp. TaxID=50741 RepID=UPI0019FA1B6A|nr:RNA polymerase sigma factor [Marinobacter sp.]MBE0484760.1 RNA polymerase sigma factor [Marinobacter sp.]